MKDERNAKPAATGKEIGLATCERQTLGACRGVGRTAWAESPCDRTKSTTWLRHKWRRLSSNETVGLSNLVVDLLNHVARQWSTQPQNWRPNIVTNTWHFGSRPSDHYFRSVCLFVCLFVCLCRVFLSRVWSDFDQTRTYVVPLSLVVSPRI